VTLPGIGTLTLSGLAHPALLLLALVPLGLLALYVVAQIQRRRRLGRYSGTAALSRVSPQRPHILRHVPVALALTGLLLLTFALAGPVHNVRIPRNRAVVMLLIDVSQSMEAKDVPPTRLRAAQDAAKQFAQQLTPGVNLVLVSFSGNVNLLVSPTRTTAPPWPRWTTCELTTQPPTGEAIFTALESIHTVRPPTSPSSTVATPRCCSRSATRR